MPRRVSLPTADDLFRPTSEAEEAAATASGPARRPRAVQSVPQPSDAAAESASRRSSGRVRHDEKMTVYVTAEELLDLEHARLGLRREHGLAVDRGRLVREAIALALADVEEHGADSALVRRLLGDS
ncbi:MAG: hypothetical protein ACTHNS_11800 [Marmoricola sp.]